MTSEQLAAIRRLGDRQQKGAIESGGYSGAGHYFLPKNLAAAAKSFLQSLRRSMGAIFGNALKER
jgi:hypothetical protein